MGDTEQRAKYTQKQVDALGAEGKAFKNPDGSFSYPVDDLEDLKNAIRAVGRGNADHDAIRAYVIKRAKALGQSDLIPDNWGSDGSLKEAKGVWSTPEERDTYNDLYRALSTAIQDAYPGGDLYCCWVQDFTDDWVVYQFGSDLYQASYENNAGAITLGTPTKVRQVTTYVADRKADPELEQRRRKAESLRGTVERRQFSSSLECRTLDDGTIRMGGYASVTETPYTVGPFTETIKRGAFKRTLSEDPSVVFLANHEGLPMATTKSGTLVLHEDARGLRWDADLDPLDEDSVKLARKVERGLVEDCSFAFLCTDDSWSEDRSRRDVRSLSLHKGDVSCVTYGASEATSVSLRELASDLEQRSGKVLSGANLAEIEAIHEASGRLIELSKTPEPETEPTLSEVALEAVTEQTEEVAREAEEPPEKAVLVPDGKRERERLAALRRAA